MQAFIAEFYRVHKNDRFFAPAWKGFAAREIATLMPVDFLTASQRQRYGSYPGFLSADELGRHFHLDDDDRQWVSTKRRDGSRLGCALQLVTVRFLGTFLEDPVAVPIGVLQTVAAQIDVADLACATTYRQSEQRWRHTAEIRARCGYREFVDQGVQYRLGRWLCALCWTGTDRPSLLFDHACGWLIGHKVLLPGISILERFIAEVRSRMEARLWGSVASFRVRVKMG